MRRLKEKVSVHGRATRLVEMCSHIRDLIADDQIGDALNRLKEVAESLDSERANDLIDLVRQFRNLERSELAGTLTREAASAEKSRITRFLLQLTDELDSQREARIATPSLSPAEVKARTAYLDILRRDVQNRLDVSIHRARFIDLGLGDTPSATHLPWVFKDPNSLQEFAKIEDAFDEYKRRLLLLGAPGSGKTVTLLNITKRLIEEAEAKSSAPIPLLVNLSKFQLRTSASVFRLWGGKESAVETRDDRVERWLLGELTEYPVIPVEIARKWIGEGRMAALLDGLDEVNDEYRAELVRVLNATYLWEHPESPVVVCSRINEYRPLQDRKETQVQLEGAVTLQPLNKTQIADYLNKAKATGLGHALLGDETLAQMAQTPLTLSMMTLAYGGSDPADIPSFSTLTEQRHHLMEAYVEKMLQRKEQRDRPERRDEEVPEEEYAYRPERTNSYLGWLAVRLSVRMQTAFSVHGLFSFLTREIDRDRQPGVWWATVLCRAPVILLLALFAGAAVAPASTQAATHVLYAGLACAAAYVLAAWAMRLNDDMNSLLTGVKYVFIYLLFIIIIGGGVGVASQALSSVLPFGIPPAAAGITALSLGIIGMLMAATTYGDAVAWRRFIIGFTIGAFAAGLFVMESRFGSQYGWYIPAGMMAAGLTLSAGLFFVFDDEKGLAGILQLVAALVVMILVASARVVGLPGWQESLITFLGLAVILLATVPKPLLILVSFLVSFVVGAMAGRFLLPAGASAGSMLGTLIYGYLLVLSLFYFSEHTKRGELLTRFAGLVQYSVGRVEKTADRYILSPVLMRVVIFIRCLPMRYVPFFKYVEQALLLKRSAADIEFMHRLLRDYFALRDLQPLLKSPDAGRRLAAIRSLGFQGDAAIDALAEFVRSQSPDVREAAAWAFGRIASPEVVSHIEAALQDTEARVRAAAVSSLKNLPEGEYMRLITLVINDNDPLVQRTWLETTLSLPDRYSLESYKYTGGGSLFTDRMLAAVSARDELKQILFNFVEAHPNQSLRRIAIEIISPLRDERSLPALVAALTDRRFSYRYYAASALGELGDPRAVKPLSKLLSVRDKTLRRAAESALYRIRTREDDDTDALGKLP